MMLQPPAVLRRLRTAVYVLLLPFLQFAMALSRPSTPIRLRIWCAFAVLGAPGGLAAQGTASTPAEVYAIHRHVSERGLTDSPVAWTMAGDTSRYVFLNMSEFWPHSVVPGSDSVRDLPVRLRTDVATFEVASSEGRTPLQEYVQHPAVDGLVVVHRGTIVFEAYPRMRRYDRHVLFSVSKTFVSTVVAVLEARGDIDLADPVDTYLPGLRGTAWAGVPLRDVLDMASGVDCPMRFAPASACLPSVYASYGFPTREAAAEDFAAALAAVPSGRPSGEAYEYVDVNTLVLTMVAEAVTGERFVELLRREVWAKIGAESDALMLEAAYGRPATSLGLSTTLRDLARYGMVFTPSGWTSEDPVLSEEAVRRILQSRRPELFSRATIPAAFPDEADPANGFQWDHVTAEGDLFKSGHNGQGLYVSPGRDLVVAYFGTWTSERETHELHRAARQLATSTVFDE